MPEGRQEEFFFVDGSPPPDGVDAPPSSLEEEIAAMRGVPAGRRGRVRLKQHELPGLEGFVEVAAMPDLPLDSHRVLRLRIGHVMFTNRQIESWAAMDHSR
ncbi:MAG: hypothetical protein ACREIA_15660 [Opitutaceae bacterium]